LFRDAAANKVVNAIVTAQPTMPTRNLRSISQSDRGHAHL